MVTPEEPQTSAANVVFDTAAINNETLKHGLYQSAVKIKSK